MPTSFPMKFSYQQTEDVGQVTAIYPLGAVIISEVIFNFKHNWLPLTLADIAAPTLA